MPMEVEDLQREVKAAVTPVMTAFEEFKKTNDEKITALEKKGAVDPLVTDKLDKIEKSLVAYEGLNQKLTQAEAKAKALEEQQGAQNALLAKLEAKLGRPSAHTTIEHEREFKQRVNDWVRGVISASYGRTVLPEQQKAIEDAIAECKALTISNDTTGGYLSQVEYSTEMIKAVVLISPVRSLVRVFPTANKARQVPKRTGVFSAVRTTESGTRTETTGLTYGLEEVTAPEMYALVDISNENLEDSAFDMETELKTEAAEQFSVREGYEFVSGTGTGEMQGILTNAALTGSTIGVTNSGAATTIGTGDTILTGLFYGLKTAYAQNAQWILNRTTLGQARTLKDGNGQYIWIPGIASAQPNTINGATYVEFPDMPNAGTNTYPIGFGDWRRAYAMVDRLALNFLRDPYTQATAGNVRMYFRRRVGGKVMLGEAIRLLKCAV